MSLIKAFEGPLCCNTGVCGADPAQSLVNFTADARWVADQGGRLTRANLAQDPAAFADGGPALAFLQTAGADALPLVTVDGLTVLTGRYPTRSELARYAGLTSDASTAAACCGDEAAEPGCCSAHNPDLAGHDSQPRMLRRGPVRFLDDLPRYVFFTGKGGVGKTSVACATAVDLADRGGRVLLVSTDPASNVGHVFGQTVGDRITAIAVVPGLDALEIDPAEAAAAYRDRTLAPVRNVLSAADLAAVTEQLSGACTTEIASFNQFTDLLANSDATSGYDHIVFDTAPTGHTIRLLQLPGEWTRFIDDGRGDTSCLGPMSGLEKSRSTYGRALATLADPTSTRLALVARAQAGALTEAARTVEELTEAGVRATHLIVNGVMPPSRRPDHLADIIRDQELRALADLPKELSGLIRDLIPLRGVDIVGVPALRALLGAESPAAGMPRTTAAPPLPGLDALVDELARRDHGLIMCMGKGGVGKTTIASALAIRLAERGKDVHLTTTDPAAHLDPSLASDRLSVSSIDPDQATADYRARVMATKGATLDEDGRAALAEDLRSPCTEEVAVFQAFSRAVAEAQRRFVVMDTAPTGHTLLLMDATGSYHNEIVRNMADGMNYTTPLMRLQNPDYTRVIIITLAETTPVLEAEQLQADLERADIHPWAWVINQTLADTHTDSPLLRQRQAAEAGPLAAIQRNGRRVAQVRWGDASATRSHPIPGALAGAR